MPVPKQPEPLNRVQQAVPSNNSSANGNTTHSGVSDNGKLRALPQPVWQNILSQIQRLNPGVHGALNGSCAYVNDTVLAIVVDEGTYISVIKNNINFIMDVVSQNLNKDYKVYVKAKGNGNTTQNNGLNNSVNDLVSRAEKNNIPTQQVD
jgi:hypothetical protein